MLRTMRHLLLIIELRGVIRERQQFLEQILAILRLMKVYTINIQFAQKNETTGNCLYKNVEERNNTYRYGSSVDTTFSDTT